MNKFTEASGINPSESPQTNVPTPQTQEVTTNPDDNNNTVEQTPTATPDPVEQYYNTPTPEPTPQENKVSPEEGAAEYLKLIDLMTRTVEEVKAKTEELEQNIKTLKENSSQSESPAQVAEEDEDPRKVVRRISPNNEEVPSEQEPTSLAEIFDNYKQALNQDPTTEFPKELVTSPYFLDLSPIPTDSEQTDPFIERAPETQEKQVVFPFVSSTGELKRWTFEYELFTTAFQEGIQPQSGGVYIEIAEEGKQSQIVKLGRYQFDKLSNAIAAVEQEQDTNNLAPQETIPAQETPAAQEPPTPETNQFDYSMPPTSKGFGM